MPSPITNYIEQRKEEFDKLGDYHELSNGEDEYVPSSMKEIKSFHTETLTTVLGMVREMVEKVEIKGRNSFEGDDTKEKGKFLQEMYDNMIKPVLLSSLPDIT